MKDKEILIKVTDKEAFMWSQCGSYEHWLESLSGALRIYNTNETIKKRFKSAHHKKIAGHLGELLTSEKTPNLKANDIQGYLDKLSIGKHGYLGKPSFLFKLKETALATFKLKAFEDNYIEAEVAKQKKALQDKHTKELDDKQKEHNDEKTKLQEQIKKLESAVETTEKKTEELKTKFEQFSKDKELTERDNKFKDLEKKHTKLGEDMQEKIKENNTLTTKVTALELNLNEVKDQSEEVKELRKSNNALTSELEVQQKAYADLHKQFIQTKNTNTELQLMVGMQKEQINQVTTEQTTMTTLNKTQHVRITELEADYIALQASLKITDAKIAKSNETVKVYQELSEKQTEQILTLSSERDAVKEKLQTANTKISELEKAMEKAIEKYKAEIKQLLQQIKAFEQITLPLTEFIKKLFPSTSSTKVDKAPKTKVLDPKTISGKTHTFENITIEDGVANAMATLVNGQIPRVEKPVIENAHANANATLKKSSSLTGRLKFPFFNNQSPNTQEYPLPVVRSASEDAASSQTPPQKN